MATVLFPPAVPTVGMLVCLGVGAFGNAGNWCWITAEHVALRFITYFLPFSLAVAGCVVSPHSL
jgi:hypothetical protein